MNYTIITSLDDLQSGEITGNEYILVTTKDKSFKMKYSSFIDSFENQINDYLDDNTSLIESKLDKTHDMSLTLEGDATGSTFFYNMNNATLNLTTVPNIAKLDTAQLWTAKQTFSNNTNLTFGDVDQLKIFSDGANSVIDHSGSGALILKSNQLLIRNFTGGNAALFNTDGSALLYHDGGLRFETAVDGALVHGELETQTLQVTENAEIQGDLYLNEHIITEKMNVQGIDAVSTIELSNNLEESLGQIRGDDTGFGLYDDSTNTWLVQGQKGEGVDLYYNTNKVLSTMSTGITVYGEIRVDSLDVNGRIDLNDGGNSVFVGDGAGQVSDANNRLATSLGFYSGQFNVSGNHWTAIGARSGYKNTGSEWTAIGKDAGYSSETGERWTALGVSAGFSNTNGEDWVAIGHSAAFNNVFGGNFTAIGAFAGFSNTDGEDWIAIGHNSALASTTGSDFVAVGKGAGALNTIGNNWVAIGKEAGSKNADGHNWIAIGKEAAQSNIEGSDFIAIGTQSAHVNETGIDFISIGSESGMSNTTGSDWLAIGKQSAKENVDGSGFIAIGKESAFSNISGTDFIAIGNDAGSKIADGLTGATNFNNSVYIGHNTRVSADGVSNESAIGFGAIGLGSDTIKLGNDTLDKVGTHGDIEVLDQNKGFVLTDIADENVRWRISIDNGRIVTNSI